MRKLFSSLLAVAFALVAVALPIQQVEAIDGLKYWHFTIRDQQDDEITTGLTVTVRTVNTTTSATIYSTEQKGAKSNAFDPGTDAVADFWSAATTLDIHVSDGVSEFTLQDAIVSEHDIRLMQTDSAEKIIQLPIGQFYIVYNIAAGAALPPDAIQPITGERLEVGSGYVSAPNYDIQNSIGCIVWADGEESQIETSFRVPADYSSGGGFRVWANSSATGLNQPYLDYSYYINSDSGTADTASTDETAVEISSIFDGTAASENEYDLTITDTLTIGDLVTLRLWRDDLTSTGTGSLEVYHVLFYYSSKH